MFKHHLPCLHTSAVFEAGSKSLSRTSTNKFNPLGLDAFQTDVPLLQIQMRDRSIDLEHLRQILAECNCARQLFDFTDDSHHNIYTPWTQVHRTSAPSSPQSFHPKLISTMVWFDFKAVAKAWRTKKTLRSIRFWCLLEKRKIQCFDLRVLGLNLKYSSKRSFLSTNQNRSKNLEDHMMPKSRCPRIALKCWYYHYQ